jgi:hypothetical protein
MAHMAPQIKNRALTEIFIPGSHDSATYNLEYTIAKGQGFSTGLNVISGRAGIGHMLKQWAQAQEESVLAQLEGGIRYLDLRVIYRDSEKQFYTVHGLYGPSLSDILSQITQFIKQNPKEIVIIQVGDLRHMPRGIQDHQELISLLQNTFGDKLIPKSLGLHAPMETIWKQGKQLVLIYNNNTVAKRYDTIFSNKSIDSFWANKNSVPELRKKLSERLLKRQKKNNQLYVIQSQLTANRRSIAKSFVSFKKHFNSLKDMAQGVKKEFPDMLAEWAKYGPAIVQLDFVGKSTSEAVVKMNQAFFKDEDVVPGI